MVVYHVSELIMRVNKKRGIEMNKIEKLRTELEKYEEKYALLIKYIQEEIKANLFRY